MATGVAVFKHIENFTSKHLFALVNVSPVSNGRDEPEVPYPRQSR